MPLCTANRRDGAPCAAQALAGNQHCFFHSPSAEHARARSRGRRQGGIVVRSRSQIVQASDMAAVELQTPRDVTTLLSETISQLRRGEIDAKSANAIAYVSNVALTSLQLEAEHNPKGTVVNFNILPPMEPIPIDPYRTTPRGE
jgi:hypothetical protein